MAVTTHYRDAALTQLTAELATCVERRDRAHRKLGWLLRQWPRGATWQREWRETHEEWSRAHAQCVALGVDETERR